MQKKTKKTKGSNNKCMFEKSPDSIFLFTNNN